MGEKFMNSELNQQFLSLMKKEGVHLTPSQAEVAQAILTLLESSPKLMGFATHCGMGKSFLFEKLEYFFHSLPPTSDMSWLADNPFLTDECKKQLMETLR